MLGPMVRKQVLVQLDDAQVGALDEIAAATDANRSELIRRAIDLYVAATGEAVDDLRYADAYRRLPEDLRELEAWNELSLETWPRSRAPR